MSQAPPEAPGQVTRVTKIPADLAERIDELAQRRRVTMSSLLRALIEAAVADDSGESERGQVESQVLAEIEAIGYQGAPGRIAVALELARQLDGTRTNSPAVSAQIRMLLAEMRESSPAAALRFDRLIMLRLQCQLVMHGQFKVVDATGHEFNINTDWPTDGSFEGIV
jgi:hypothetical protein